MIYPYSGSIPLFPKLDERYCRTSMDAMTGGRCWYDLGHVGLLYKNTTGAEVAPDARGVV